MDLDLRLSAFLPLWHGVGTGRDGLPGLRRTVRQLQGIPLPDSDLETWILPARIRDYSPQQLDELITAGEVVWQGCQARGDHDGWIQIFLREDFPALGRISVFQPGAREQRIRELLMTEAPIDFGKINECLGGFGDDLLKTLWKLVWNGEVTADSLDALRARRTSLASRYRGRPRPRYTTRRRMLPGAAGRWKLLSGPDSGFAPDADRRIARAGQWLHRYGIVCRETLAGEDISMEEALPWLEQLESAGRAERDGIQGLDAPHFAAPGAGAAWREAAGREVPGRVLAACDPANPYGLFHPWPPMAAGYRPQRSPGARVLLWRGALAGYVTRTGRGLYTTRCPDPDGGGEWIALLRGMAASGPLFLESVDGEPAYRTRWHGDLVAAGFSPSRRGYLLRAGR